MIRFLIQGIPYVVASAMLDSLHIPFPAWQGIVILLSLAALHWMTAYYERKAK